MSKNTSNGKISQQQPWYYGQQDKLSGGSALLYSNRYNPGLGTYRRQLDCHPPQKGKRRAGRKAGSSNAAAALNTLGGGQMPSSDALLLATEGNLCLPRTGSEARSSSLFQNRNQSPFNLIQSAPSLLEGGLENTHHWTIGDTGSTLGRTNNSTMTDLAMTVNQSGVRTDGPMTELQTALECCRGTKNIELRAQDRAARLESQALATRRRQAKDHADWLITGTLKLNTKKQGPVVTYADEQAAHYGLVTGPSNPWRHQMSNPTNMNKVRKRRVRAVGGMACVTDQAPKVHHDPNDEKVFAEVIAGVERELNLRYRILWEEMAEVLWHLHKREFSLPGDQTIDLLNEAMVNTASENPDPRLLSRQQFLEITRQKLPGCPERSLSRIYSGLDPRRTDRVQFARFSALLVAGYRSEGQDKILNPDVITEFHGPYKQALQILSRMFELYKDPLAGSISLEDIRLIFLSCIRSDEDLASIDKLGRTEELWNQTRLSVKWNGYSQLRVIENKSNFLEEVKLHPLLLEVFQEQLNTFQRFMKHAFRIKGTTVPDA